MKVLHRYYVNVFDIDMLAGLDSYIACTSERIFAEKPQLYDVYVNGNEVTCTSAELRRQIAITATDQSRFGLLSGPTYTEGDESEYNLRNYFAKFNTDLIQKIEALCSIDRGDGAAAGVGVREGLREAYRIRAPDLNERVGLHRNDAAFLREFAQIREYKLEVVSSPFDFCGCC